MPNKNWGTNSKAAEAKARETEKKRAAAEKKQQEAEDAYWKDDDKHAQKKMERKEDKQKKHEEELRRREENRKLLEMESAQLKAAKPKSAVAARPTRAQIEVAREKVDMEEKKRLGLLPAKESSSASLSNEAASGTRKKDSDDSDSELPPLEENINRALRINEGDGSARNVNEALLLLGDDDADTHPERRMKKAHLEFEEAMMAKLKAEYPTMRRSQLKEMIWREWQRSPQNPLNKAAKASTDNPSTTSE